MKHVSTLATTALAFLSLVAVLGAEPKDYPVQPVPFTAVKVSDGFWTPRLETNRAVTVWYDFQKCEETGRIDNFAKAAGLMPGAFVGIPFNDSDVYKVIEGAACVLAMQPDPKLDAYLDGVIAKIAASQEPDGYLYTARRLCAPDKIPAMSGKERWSNLAHSHELYNVGHLFEAAVAHYQATGKTNFLNVATKNADFLCETFGPGKLQEPPGHEEIEIGLVKLYRATGRKKYLDLAKFYVDIRGDESTHKLRGAYQQDDVPILKQDQAVGHAVRAGYFYSGVADVAAMTGQAEYVNAMDRIWEDVVHRKMHLTGGIGARRSGEAFGDAYELPNASAYLETCAAIANAYWNHRMFLLHGDAQYLDVLERVLYNGFLSGISIEGNTFFYPNPLESDGRTKFNQGSNTRSPWFNCSCCPVNVVRFIPNIANYIYATRGENLYVNLFIGGAAKATLGGNVVKVRQETKYPWDGKVRIIVEPDAPGEFTVRVRIPGWALGRPVPGDLYRYTNAGAEPPKLRVNRRTVPLEMDKGFAVLHRTWKKGDAIELDLPMPIRRVLAHDAVKDDAGRVAIERGPVVFCAEAADNHGHALNLVLPDAAKLKEQFRSKLLGGVMVLRGKGVAVQRDQRGGVASTPAEITLIPYYAWNHRDANEMTVWLPRTPERATAPPARSLAGESAVTASYVNKADSLQALTDQLEPKSSGDQAVPRFTWWDHRGTTEWVQYDFPRPATVCGVEVYWFDDTGTGRCRIPQSWKLLFREGDSWKPVLGAADFGTKPDIFNRVTFAPVRTTGLRVEAQLQPNFSGGVLEWRLVESPAR